jgi:hypothetical protein
VRAASATGRAGRARARRRPTAPPGGAAPKGCAARALVRATPTARWVPCAASDRRSHGAT